LADQERRREDDRGFEDAPLADRVDPDQLAVPVEDVGAGVDGLGPGEALVRHDHGHAGANRLGVPVVPFDHGPVTDPNARDVGDRVRRSRHSATDGDAEVAGTRARHGPLPYWPWGSSASVSRSAVRPSSCSSGWPWIAPPGRRPISTLTTSTASTRS